MTYLSLADLPIKNKKILLRVDFNVPFNEKGEITDLTRIKASLPSIDYILKNGGSLILLSHRGRPKGKEEKLSLKPCATALAKLLHRPVLFTEDCLGEETKNKVSALLPGEILLLENLRFYKAEEDPELDPSFAKTLASYGDLYVNDAFGTAHRKHASTYTLASYFPKKSAAGFLMEKEITALSKLIHQPKLPFHVIVGGAKISSKIPILEALLPHMQALYIGGAMAFTFLLALGYVIGDSLFEKDQVKAAINILESCKKKNIPLFLPLDIIASNGTSIKAINISDGIEKGWKGMDVGPQTLDLWEKEILKANSIFWNGPLGAFEDPSFSKGTFSLAKFLATLSSERVIGGGDSVAAIEKLHLTEKFTHISTGGGASLEFLEQGTLPGIDALCMQ